MKEILFFRRNNLFRDTIIAFIITITPFMFFLYTITPKNTTVWNTRFFSINFNNGNDIDQTLWIMSYKLLALVLFAIWFVTCKHWWRFVILIPFSMELSKFFSIINEMFKWILNYNFIYIIPILIPLILFLIFLSKELNFYSSKKSLNNELNEEIDLLMQNLSRFKSKNYKDFKQQLILIRQEKHTLEKKEYLFKLIKLREDFSKQK